MDSWTRLVAIVAGLEAQYLEGDSHWIGSPFAWIKTRPSRQVGAIGEKIDGRRICRPCMRLHTKNYMKRKMEKMK